MDKKAVVHIHIGILLGHNKILPFATAWMDLEDIILIEISQTEEEQIPYDFTLCGI